MDYIFLKCAALRENIVPRENITILAPPTRDISSVLVDICYIRWSKLIISSKLYGALWLRWSLVTRIGVCVQNNLNANFTSLRAFYYDVLLLTTAYSTCVVHFSLGQFPNMEMMLLLLSPLLGDMLHCSISPIEFVRILLFTTLFLLSVWILGPWYLKNRINNHVEIFTVSLSLSGIARLSFSVWSLNHNVIQVPFCVLTLSLISSYPFIIN